MENETHIVLGYCCCHVMLFSFVLLASPFSLSGVCLGSKDVEKWNRTEFGNYGAKRSNQYPILRRLVAKGNSCKWLSSIYKSLTYV